MSNLVWDDELEDIAHKFSIVLERFLDSHCFQCGLQPKNNFIFTNDLGKNLIIRYNDLLNKPECHDYLKNFERIYKKQDIVITKTKIYYTNYIFDYNIERLNDDYSKLNIKINEAFSSK